jgi:hypothetical protein
MTRKRGAKPRAARRRASRHRSEPVDDTAIRSLSKEEIKRMSIDSWEPSLLRNMLEAVNKLRPR